eukprot:TRINITY_DN27520_c0_g1_i1.p1 TRINITY_DN27520_c0_g1~~TRINITY_DN27520_c0_g1_i1.p1  ORF type:complete len:534 (+),score=85.11 TRINITY_DN27520_c0_g1_i1:203-1804(+)
MLSWRFFRIWAIADRVPAPENVVFCIASCDSIRSLWRCWHVSFYAWMQRYLYLPLGGSRVAWAPLNVMATFFFVFFVHNPEMTRVDSYGAVFGFFAIAVLFEVAMSRLRGTSKQESMSVLEPCISACLLYGPGMLVLMSMVGVQGWGQTLQLLRRVPGRAETLVQAVVLFWLASSSIFAARAARSKSASPAEERSYGSCCNTRSLQRLSYLPVPLVIGCAAMMIYCYTLSDWHWERFQPYLIPEVWHGRSNVKWSGAGPFYSSCESLRLSAFVRAPMNAGSSTFALLTPAYLLWHVPKDAPRIMQTLSEIEAGDIVGGFLSMLFFCFLVCHLAVACTSFLWHSSITQQAHYYDILVTQGIAVTQSVVLEGLHALPNVNAASLSLKNDEKAARKIAVLAVLSVALPFALLMIFMGKWIDVYGVLLPFLVLLNTWNMMLLARIHVHEAQVHGYFAWAAIVSLAAALLKTMDEKQEWAQAEIFCNSKSLLQFTALMHIGFGLASFLSTVAARRVILRRFDYTARVDDGCREQNFGK